ncbi:nuclear transport factor 2 family protein [Massilia sp. METH4]|uniref:YybH family protein n=1 Tax=Massilia sp. METH4 TaxID=3123041 RepID=UPI0030D1D4E7
MPKKQHNGSPAEVEAAFYDAMSRADVDALMALWADDEEIVCIQPNGLRLLGHRAIRESYEMLLEHGGVHIQPTQLHEMHNLMSAVHTVVEGTTVLRGDQGHLVATNVYLKTPKGWRIVAHHVSVAPGPTPSDTHSQVLH